MDTEMALYSHLPSGRVVLYVDPRKGRSHLRARQLRRPRTDDMVQMLADLGVDAGEVTFEAWTATFMRNMADSLALPYEMLVGDSLVDEEA